MNKRAKSQKKSSPAAVRHGDIAEKIGAALLALPVGSPVPSSTQWCERLGASRATVMRAFASLRAKGLIDTKVGVGTRVGRPVRNRLILMVYPAQHRVAEVGEFFLGAAEAIRAQQDLIITPICAELIGGERDLVREHPGLSGVIFFRDPGACQTFQALYGDRSIPTLLYGSSAYAADEASLCVDEAHVAHTALDALSGTGKTRIGVVYAADHAPGKARWQAWIDWHYRQGRMIDPVLALALEKDQLPHEHPRFHAWINHIDGVFAAEDKLAVNVLSGALALGLSVPQKIAVVGVGNQPLGFYLRPALSSVEIPLQAHGRLAIQAILGHQVPRPLKDAFLVERESLACESKSKRVKLKTT